MNSDQCSCGGSFDEYDLCFECDRPRDLAEDSDWPADDIGKLL